MDIKKSAKAGQMVRVVAPCAFECHHSRVLLECVQGYGEGSRPDTALRPEVLPDANTTSSRGPPDTDPQE